jgi:hypothetical protein
VSSGARTMAELTSLDEKLAEVLGLAQVAQEAAQKVQWMDGGQAFGDQLERMHRDALELEQRLEDLVDRMEGRRSAIQDKARETRGEARDMMQTYLAGEEEALDGFEFLTMFEAGELGHWEIVRVMAERTGFLELRELAHHALTLQRRHVDAVREASLELAAAEADRNL